MCSFLDALEIVALQVLNKWMYSTALSRAQVKFRLVKYVYLSTHKASAHIHTLYIYNALRGSVQKIEDPRFEFNR